MHYLQEGRDLGTTLEVYIKVFSTRLLRISDIGSWLLLVPSSKVSRSDLLLCPVIANMLDRWTLFYFSVLLGFI